MKTKKYYLVLAVLTGILCVPALSGTELPRPAERGLIGQANPTLAGIEKLCLVIVPPHAEPNTDGLVWHQLQLKIDQKLIKAGIKITPAIAGNILNVPELRVYIDMLKLDDLQKYVFRIQTSLSRSVCLEKALELRLKADVWKVDPTMQVVSVQDMPAALTDSVLEQVEAFIHAYLAANPPDKQSSDVKTSDTASLSPQKEPTKPPTKAAVAEYKYVASKNSKVFHKPDCRWAKRIKPENLIGYNSRDEAIQAGKRPCKWCNP